MESTNHLSENQLQLVSLARRLAAEELLPCAAETDQAAIWPRNALKALGREGLLGLHVPKGQGGHGEGLYTLALVTEELGRACASTAMCFGMHSVASKVIASRPTEFQQERYLRSIACGEHVTSLALSEPGSGAHFYIPQATFSTDGDHYVLNGAKSFVTSGGEADSYVVSAVAAESDADPGTFSCFLLDKGTGGLSWGDAWNGFGMRGNSSCGATLHEVQVPSANLLGAKGDQIWYVFEVIAPYFIIAMSGVYLGIAAAALQQAKDHLIERRYQHTGKTLADVPILLVQLADLWRAVERTRALVHQAARLADVSSPEAFNYVAAAKIEVADTVVLATDGALSLTGGRAYEANGTLARLARDARAAPVMSPTTQILSHWLGRSLVGLAPL